MQFPVQTFSLFACLFAVSPFVFGCHNKIADEVAITTHPTTIPAMSTGSMTGLGSSTEVIRLWSDRAPEAAGDEAQDIPTLTLYRPTSPDGSSIIICPGGGYGHLAPHEAEPPAKW